jgi:hypothetical protein
MMKMKKRKKRRKNNHPNRSQYQPQLPVIMLKIQ